MAGSSGFRRRRPYRSCRWKANGKHPAAPRTSPAMRRPWARASISSESSATTKKASASRDLAEQDGVSANLLVQPGRRTTVKIRYLAGGHQLLRADRDNREGIDIPLAARLSA